LLLPLLLQQMHARAQSQLQAWLLLCLLLLLLQQVHPRAQSQLHAWWLLSVLLLFRLVAAVPSRIAG
jgi:hypothetical protein